jgi:hypothetical protein
MNDSDEQDSWDGDRVEIVDLDVPGNTLNHFSFFPMEKLFTIALPPIKFVVFVLAISLLIAFLQPGSSFLNNQTTSTYRHVPTSFPFHQTNACAVTISITPGQTVVWPLPSTPSPSSSSVGIFMCNNGNVLPLPTGNNGTNP